MASTIVKGLYRHSDHTFLIERFVHRMQDRRLDCVIDGCEIWYLFTLNSNGETVWTEKGQTLGSLTNIWTPSDDAGVCFCTMPDPDIYVRGGTRTWQCERCKTFWMLVSTTGSYGVINKWTRRLPLKEKPIRARTIFDEIGAGDLLDSSY